VMAEGNGLDFMRARFYSPTEGSFLSPDPLGLAGGQTNLYAYAAQNPLSITDSSGLDVKRPFLSPSHDLPTDDNVGDPLGDALGALTKLPTWEFNANFGGWHALPNFTHQVDDVPILYLGNILPQSL